MSTRRTPDDLIRAFLMEGQTELADQVYDTVRATVDQRRQRTVFGPWRTPRAMNRVVPVGLVAAAVIAVVIGSQTIGLRGSAVGGPPADSSPTPQPSYAALSSADVDALNGFLQARIAGAGAEQYLDTPAGDVPLLYATTSGARYERAEFEPVPDIGWPYGWRAFKVRLFAGDTVVEQLMFRGTDGPPRLSYQPDGFATDIAPTTEDGQPLPRPYSYFDGAVTLRAAHPWVMYQRAGGRLIPDGAGVRPTTDGGERNSWDQLTFMADPGIMTDCASASASADAQALADEIHSDPGVQATAPVAVSVGGTAGLQMDVKMAKGAKICWNANEVGDPTSQTAGVLVPLEDAASVQEAGWLAFGSATGDWMRLYLVDAPAGSSMRVLAIAVVAPESDFERAVAAAAPVVDSIEFHAP